MVPRENRPPLAFGVIGCHIVAGEALLPPDPVLPDPEQHTVLASLKCPPVPAHELDFFSFAHCVLSPFRFPVLGSCLLGLASASEVSLETALGQFRVIDRALVLVQLFTVLASP